MVFVNNNVRTYKNLYMKNKNSKCFRDEIFPIYSIIILHTFILNSTFVELSVNDQLKEKKNEIAPSFNMNKKERNSKS